MRLHFTIGDLLWLTVVVALGGGWIIGQWIHQQRGTPPPGFPLPINSRSVERAMRPDVINPRTLQSLNSLNDLPEIRVR